MYPPTPGFEVDETCPLAPESPHSRTKHVTEMVLADMAAATDLRAISLRYFNPIGSGPDQPGSEKATNRTSCSSSARRTRG